MCAMADKGRIRTLDGLRALAILSVFVHHALGVPLLWIGVDLFFVLSGFLITGILLDLKERGGRYYGHFYERRARRILLPYVLSLLVSSCLFGFGWSKYWYWFAFFGTNVGAALGQITHDSLLQLWSLAVEEQFYLIWPVVVLVLSQKGLGIAACSGVIAAPVLRALATPFFSSHFPIYFLTPFRMDLLCAGAALAVLWKVRRDVFVRLQLVAYACAGVSGASVMWLSHFRWFRTSANTVAGNVMLYSLVLVFVTSLVVIALGQAGPVCVLLRMAPLGFIGRISYSMYLVHAAAIIWLQSIFRGRASVFVAALAATVLYATASWYGLEKWLLGGPSGDLHANQSAGVGSSPDALKDIVLR